MIKKIAYKLLGNNYTRMAVCCNQLWTYLYSYIHPYHYNPSRYIDTFLSNEASNLQKSKKKIDRVIYIFWTGNNEITPNRLKGIATLEKVSGIKVQLITPNNLSNYLVKDDPLPEAFQYLSLNHKSDYLRSYFMHHYGGGYADIKTYYHSWINAFDLLETSDSAYVIGYPEVGFWGAANQDMPDGPLKYDLHYYWRLLIGNGAFICRPHTPLTSEWHEEAKRRLEKYAEDLKEHPAQDFFGSNDDYPLFWSEMQGSIFHPLCLKYNQFILKDKALMPSFKNYR